jgi:hypothetical protein
MLLNNYAIRNANQSRSLGGNLDPTYNLNLAKMNTFYAQDSSGLAPFQTNLVKNGDFELAPHKYTGGYTWLNGSPAGTSNPYLGYGWFNYNLVGSYYAEIDTTEKHSGQSSLKISLTGTGSSMGFTPAVTYQYPYNLIAVLPSTSYSFSIWIKTSLVSGSASTGVRVRANHLNASFGSLGSTTVATGIVTTTGWTQYSATITSNASAAFMNIELIVVGSDGTGTLIMDAWFDDISITLTNQVTRSSTDNNPQYFSQPAQGLRPPYSLVLAPKAGGMSMWNGGTGSTTGTGIQGLFGEATLAGSGTVSDAAAGLIVEMIATIAGLGGLTADVIGQLEASATLAGSGDLTAAQSALAGMTATLIGTGLISDAQQQALGDMQAEIFVNQSQATIEQIADAVVQAIVDMGATGGLTSEEHTQLMKTLTVGKFLGLK